MNLPPLLAFALIACLSLAVAHPARAGQVDAPLTFGVIKARNAVLTAQYWNPILRYVSRQSGVPLKLKLAKSPDEHAAAIRRGELDFIYSNVQFAPRNNTAGYAVIARQLTGTVRSQIVVPANSPLQSLDQLHGSSIAYSSKEAFAGYLLPMSALQRAGIEVKPQFAGTLAGAMGQMLSGRVPAAVVDADIARGYAVRENAVYRVLWSSEEYPGVPVAAHPAVPPEKVAAVRTALLKMADDPQGQEILAAGAPLFGRQPPHGFTAASERDYDQVRRFYMHHQPSDKSMTLSTRPSLAQAQPGSTHQAGIRRPARRYRQRLFFSRSGQ